MVNLGSSVVITDYFVRGKGKEKLENFAEKAAESLNKASGKAPGTLNKSVYAFIKTGLLLTGGTLLMAPMYWFEQNKKWFAGEANKMACGDPQYDKIEEIPDKGVGNVLWRRGLGIASTLTVGTMIGKDRQTHVEDFLSGWALQSMEKSGVSALQNVAKSETARSYIRLAALDQFFTAITAGVTYVTNGTFFGKKEEDKQAENAPAAIAQAAPAPAAASSGFPAAQAPVSQGFSALPGSMVSKPQLACAAENAALQPQAL